MNFALDPKVQKLIDERVQSGKYARPEDVIAAAIVTLDQHEDFGDFQPGELDALLAAGEHSIQQQGTLDGEEAFRRRRLRRGQAKEQAP